MTSERAIDRRRVRDHFDRAAARYDEAAVLQREVAARMLERLDLVKVDPQCVVDLGSGTGFVARALAARYPGAQVVGLDASLRMLRAGPRRSSLWTRLRGATNWSAVVAEMECLPFASQSVDMFCSNLALEWSDRPTQIFSEVQRCLRDGGLFMFTTIGPDTLRELRRASPRAGRSIHPLVDMHDVGDALINAGLSDPVMDMELITLTYGSLVALLQDLRATGSTSALHLEHRGLRGRRWLLELERGYEAMRVSGRLPATVEVVYGHCWKSGARRPRRAMEDRAIINFVRRPSGA
ncbi:MAG TPA: methyltransferase domain-containing protein [Burkholderiales bacterium]|nr:methyltransferase domain-containing protein [Burkholderiales bacterium]